MGTMLNQCFKCGNNFAKSVKEINKLEGKKRKNKMKYCDECLKKIV